MVASVWVHCFKIGRDVPKIFHVSILVISFAIGSQGNIRGFYLLNACQRWGKLCTLPRHQGVLINGYQASYIMRMNLYVIIA